MIGYSLNTQNGIRRLKPTNLRRILRAGIYQTGLFVGVVVWHIGCALLYVIILFAYIFIYPLVRSAATDVLGPPRGVGTHGVVKEP